MVHFILPEVKQTNINVFKCCVLQIKTTACGFMFCLFVSVLQKLSNNYKQENRKILVNTFQHILCWVTVGIHSCLLNFLNLAFTKRFWVQQNWGGLPLPLV